MWVELILERPLAHPFRAELRSEVAVGSSGPPPLPEPEWRIGYSGSDLLRRILGSMYQSNPSAIKSERSRRLEAVLVTHSVAVDVWIASGVGSNQKAQVSLRRLAAFDRFVFGKGRVRACQPANLEDSERFSYTAFGYHNFVWRWFSLKPPFRGYSQACH